MRRLLEFIFEDPPQYTNTDLWWLRIVLKSTIIFVLVIAILRLADIAVAWLAPTTYDSTAESLQWEVVFFVEQVSFYLNIGHYLQRLLCDFVRNVTRGELECWQLLRRSTR